LEEGDMIKVLVVDDHTILRKGIEMILSDTEDIVMTGEASDGEEALEKLVENNFDVLVLDISMPRKDGIEVLKEMKARGNTIPTLILSTFAEEEYAEIALQAGAVGYLTKDKIPEDLIDAIRKVSHNK
jgi:two-component system, NarL family, invasion response regulator UvrY